MNTKGDCTLLTSCPNFMADDTVTTELTNQEQTP